MRHSPPPVPPCSLAYLSPAAAASLLSFSLTSSASQTYTHSERECQKLDNLLLLRYLQELSSRQAAAKGKEIIRLTSLNSVELPPIPLF